MSEDSQEVKPEPTEKIELSPIKYGESDLSDVVLIIDGQEFHVHKMNEENRIEIKEVSRVAFKKLLDFMYYGKMDLDDECPASIASMTAINEGFGKLDISHNIVPDKEEHIRDFWKTASEMIELAKRFDVKKDFQNYFQRLLDYYICTSANCFVCLTIHIFGLVNELDLMFEQYKKHDYHFIKIWFESAEAAGIDQDGKLGFVCKLFNKHHNFKFIKKWAKLVEEVIVPKDDKIEFLTKLLSTLGSDK